MGIFTVIKGFAFTEKLYGRQTKLTQIFPWKILKKDLSMDILIETTAMAFNLEMKFVKVKRLGDIP